MALVRAPSSAECDTSSRPPRHEPTAAVTRSRPRADRDPANGELPALRSGDGVRVELRDERRAEVVFQLAARHLVRAWPFSGADERAIHQLLRAEQRAV